MRDTLRQLRPDFHRRRHRADRALSAGSDGQHPGLHRLQVRPQGHRLSCTRSLEPVLNETYGIIVYQEQVMQIAQILAGYSPGRSRPAAPRHGQEEEGGDGPAAGPLRPRAPPRRASTRTRQTPSSTWSTSSPATASTSRTPRAYALIAYQTAWLKANAPVEFFAASMSLDISNTDKLAVFYQDAKRQGVKIRPPDVNRSDADFEVEDGEVLYALGGIRNVGLQAMEHVVQVRGEGGPFRDLFDFVERVDPRQVNKRTLRDPGAGRRLRFHQFQPRPGDRRRRGPAGPRRRRWRPIARRARSACSAKTEWRSTARGCPRPTSGRPSSDWTRNWPRSASTFPATRWTTWSKRCGASAPIC